MDTPPETRPAIRTELRTMPLPARRVGMALTLLALILFASPQMTGRSAIGGVDTTTLGWIALAAGWVLLIAAIVIRSRRYRALAPPRE